MSEIKPGDPSFASKVADSVTDATALGNRMKDDYEETGFPKSLFYMVAEITRSAPLAMLGVAFVAGVLLTRRRY